MCIVSSSQYQPILFICVLCVSMLGISYNTPSGVDQFLMPAESTSVNPIYLISIESVASFNQYQSTHTCSMKF